MLRPQGSRRGRSNQDCPLAQLTIVSLLSQAIAERPSPGWRSHDNTTPLHPGLPWGGKIAGSLRLPAHLAAPPHPLSYFHCIFYIFKREKLSPEG